MGKDTGKGHQKKGVGTVLTLRSVGNTGKPYLLTDKEFPRRGPQTATIYPSRVPIPQVILQQRSQGRMPRVDRRGKGQRGLAGQGVPCVPATSHGDPPLGGALHHRSDRSGHPWRRVQRGQRDKRRTGEEGLVGKKTQNASQGIRAGPCLPMRPAQLPPPGTLPQATCPV